jgi:hypothetical protein
MGKFLLKEILLHSKFSKKFEKCQRNSKFLIKVLRKNATTLVGGKKNLIWRSEAKNLQKNEENLRVLKKLQSYMRDNREIEKFERGERYGVR